MRQLIDLFFLELIFGGVKWILSFILGALPNGLKFSSRYEKVEDTSPIHEARKGSYASSQ